MTDNTITALLVGGPAHGNQVKVPKNYPHYKIAVPDFKPSTFKPPLDPVELIPYHTEIYTKETVNFFGHLCSVFFYEKLFDNGTTQRLQERGRLIGELLLNDTAKLLLNEGAS